MKKFLLFSGVLLSFLNLNAQTVFNKAYHDINERSNPFVVEVNNYIYFTSTLYNANHVGETYLYKHNKDGIFHYKKFLPYVPSYGYKTKDNMLLLIGKNPTCDVFGPQQVNYISKIDSAGNLVFSSTYTVSQWDNYVTSLQYTDSSFYSFTDSVLFKNSKTGLFTFKTNLGLKNISSALLLQDHTILLSAKQASVNSLVVISASGTILSAKPFPVLLKKLMLYNNQKIMGLGTDGKLYKISPAFDLISASNFANNSFINDFQTKNDSIYAILSSTVALSNYLLSDTNFVSLSLNSTTTNSVTQTAICLNGNKVDILSDGVSKTSFSWPGDHYFVSLNQISKTSSNNFTPDLAILSVTKDSIYAAPDFFSIKYAYLKAKVKVKNVGTSVITNFKLNCYMDPRVDCGAYYYQEKFSQLSLAPNDSVEVTTGTFIAKRLIPSPSPTQTIQYCFYTSVPNGETDKTLENHNMCKTYVVDVTTSLNKLKGVANNLELFPNPFDNTITTSSETAIKKFEIYNALGTLLESQTLNGNNHIYNNPTLANGIYFIKVESEKGTQIKKVVKQ